MSPHLTLLVQAAQVSADSTALRDFAQYIGDLAAAGAMGFAWRTQARVTRIETMLTEPELGVVPNVSRLRNNSHKVNNDLHEHGIRLDGHDKDIHEINEERRHIRRRAEDRET